MSTLFGHAVERLSQSGHCFPGLLSVLGATGQQGKPDSCPQPLSCLLALRWWPGSNLGPAFVMDAAILSFSSRLPPPGESGSRFTSSLCPLRCRQATLGGGRRPICLTSQPFLPWMYFLCTLRGKQGPGFPWDRFLTAFWVFCCSLKSQLPFAHSSFSLETSASFALWTHYLPSQIHCSGPQSHRA